MKLHPFFLIFLLSCSSTLFAATPTETTTFNFSLNVIGAVCTVSVGLDDSGGGAVIDTDGSGNAPTLKLDPINLKTDFTNGLTKSTPFYVSFTDCTDVTQASYSFAGKTQTDDTTIHTISGDNAGTIGLVISTDSTLSTLLSSTDLVTTTITNGDASKELYLGYKWFGTNTVNDLGDDKNVTSTIVLNVAYQ